MQKIIRCILKVMSQLPKTHPHNQRSKYWGEMKATIINPWYIRGSQLLTPAWERNGTKKKYTETLIHTLTKAKQHNFRSMDHLIKAITTGRQGSRGQRFAIHRGQFIPCLWMPHRANNDQPPYIISCLLSSLLPHIHAFSFTLPSTGLAKNRAAR